MISYTIQTRLPFRKHKGKTVQEVLSIDMSYINFCLLKVNKFCMSPAVLNEIHSSIPAFTITQEEADRNIEKYLIFLRMESRDDLSNYYPDEEENDYYNDNLDMDQQAEEFYTHIPERYYDYPDDVSETQEDQKMKMKQQLTSTIINNRRNRGQIDSIPFLTYFNNINGASINIYLPERLIHIVNKEGRSIDVVYFSKKLNHTFTKEELLNINQSIRKRDYFVFDNGEKKFLWSSQEWIIISELLS